MEIEMMNRELEKGAGYTYDNQGNVIFQHSVNTDILPADFKPKFKFKKVIQGEEEGMNTFAVKQK
jgi:hypothetical protein